MKLRDRAYFFSTVLALWALPVFPAGVRCQEGESFIPPIAVVTEFLEAFNRHDVEAMVSMVTDDIELYYSDRNGIFSLASGTSLQLADDLHDYFARRPTVRSVVDGVVAGPVFVAFREQIVGGESSLAVYEIREGLIRRVWYYPTSEP